MQVGLSKRIYTFPDFRYLGSQLNFQKGILDYHASAGDPQKESPSIPSPWFHMFLPCQDYYEVNGPSKHHQTLRDLRSPAAR